MSSESDVTDSQMAIKQIKHQLDDIDLWRRDSVNPHIEKMNRVADDTRALRDFMEDTAGAAHLLCRIATGVRFIVRYVIIPGAVFIVGVKVILGGGDIPEWFVKLKSLLP